MPGQQDEHSARGVSFTGDMRLRWEARSADNSLGLLEIGEKNARLLRAVLVSQEIHSEPGDETGDRGAVELARVDAKLDLLLDMVSQLLRRERPNMIETTVTLWLTGAAWSCQAEVVPAVGEPLWLELYVDARLAQPLHLPVVVTAVTGRGKESEISVSFDALEESLEDLLGKLIFRQHRRMIAQQKAEMRSENS
ncbi:PilZ domain-containing protein [Sedimenticola thiotaurini]|uniref:Cyclic di-GMP receptor atypical PilZ domain-containing protein n=1 Tax=Sedimenticola thiotaurini TaxID=1543721 RepID=A0A0F7JXL1_9GAMM|nr:PilZ domain-containing protein [Sedimenticola thiotaurini]AKH19540.1 hypothetical protein AAY24_03300 [Sedimenticola thiotaurini]